MSILSRYISPRSSLPGRLRGLEVVPARAFARAGAALGRVGDLRRTSEDLRSILDGRHYDFHAHFLLSLPIVS